MTAWFGPAPFADFCSPYDQLPYDAHPGPCAGCGEPILEDDHGVFLPHVRGWGTEVEVTSLPWHAVCHLRQILGGANHLLGRCRCHGLDAPPDPPGLSPREAARFAELVWLHQVGVTPS